MIAVPVNISGSQDVAPRQFGVAQADLFVETAARFRNDFETARHRVENLLVGLKIIMALARDKRLREPDIVRMSISDCRERSESIDGVTLDRRPN